MADVGVTEEGIVIAGELMLTWQEVDEQRNAFRFKNSVLVKVSFQYGRVSHMEDAGIYDRDEWTNIKEALEGTTAYFSDFAGKHSETSVDFWSNVDVEEIINLQQIIDFHNINGMSDGNLDIIQGGLEQALEYDQITVDHEGRYHKTPEE